MHPHPRWRPVRCAAAAGLVALVLALPTARADVPRTGDEPWYRQAPADARRQATKLHVAAVRAHDALLRGPAMELYENALELWDNPDIRWNLALVLADLGQYLRAHEQLEGALSWGQALGDERLQQVRDSMRVLETRRLAMLTVTMSEPGGEVKLDGKLWFRGPDRRQAFVLPGEHYVSASKPGYFPVTRSVSVRAGQQASVELRMDPDRLVETRQWAWWKPWVVVAAGAAVAAAGTVLERQAFAHQGDAVAALADDCVDIECDPTTPDSYKDAVTENRLALGALAVGGTVVAVGLALAWLNQPRAYRTEAPDPSPIELTPILSSDRAGVSARIRF